MGTNAEIHQLDVAILRQQDVVPFDVPMHAVVLVEKHQRVHRLSQNVRNLVVGQPGATVA